MDDYRAALDYMAGRFPGKPLWAAGFSFGSWIAWNVGLDDQRVAVLLGIGLPVDRFDFGPVRSSPKAKFVIHGERDELISIRDIRKFYAELSEPKELVVIEDANHLFDGKTSEVGDAVEDLLGGADVASLCATRRPRRSGRTRRVAPCRMPLLSLP